jgi:hypothetical protein
MPEGAESTVVLAAALVLFALVMLGIHWNTWQRADHGGLSDRDRLYYSRQFRRRILSSGMLGLMGLLMLGGLWIEATWAQALFWVGMLLGILAVMLLALTDWWSSRAHFGRDEVFNAAQIELLKAEIRKYESEERKGQE